MLMVVMNNGKLKFLGMCLGVDPNPLEDFVVKLYSNDFTPVNASVSADFTEATFTGYAALPLLFGGFSAPAIVANVAESEYTAPVFACTAGAPQTVYGWWVEGDTSGLAYLAQRFNTPRVMAPGAVEVLDPFKIKLKTFT